MISVSAAKTLVGLPVGHSPCATRGGDGHTPSPESSPGIMLRVQRRSSDPPRSGADRTLIRRVIRSRSARRRTRCTRAAGRARRPADPRTRWTCVRESRAGGSRRGCSSSARPGTRRRARARDHSRTTHPPGVTRRTGAAPTVTSSAPAMRQRMPPPRCRCGSATPPGAKSTRSARITYSARGSRSIACSRSARVAPAGPPTGSPPRSSS
jgi:hypothetical protein